MLVPPALEEASQRADIPPRVSLRSDPEMTAGAPGCLTEHVLQHRAPGRDPDRAISSVLWGRQLRGRGVDVLGALSPQPGLAAPKTPASSSRTEWREGRGHLLLPRDAEGPTGCRERRLPSTKPHPGSAWTSRGESLRPPDSSLSFPLPSPRLVLIFHVC